MITAIGYAKKINMIGSCTRLVVLFFSPLNYLKKPDFL